MTHVVLTIRVVVQVALAMGAVIIIPVPSLGILAALLGLVPRAGTVVVTRDTVLRPMVNAAMADTTALLGNTVVSGMGRQSAVPPQGVLGGVMVAALEVRWDLVEKLKRLRLTLPKHRLRAHTRILMRIMSIIIQHTTGWWPRV